MQKKRHPRPVRKKLRYLTPEQAKALLEFLEDSDELPEHESPFKLYLNGRLVGSAQPQKIIDNKTS